MTTLTPRQQDILTFVTQFIGTHCYSPTIREITDGLGLPSTSHVAYILDRLQDAGYLTRQPIKARSIVLTAKGWEA